MDCQGNPHGLFFWGGVEEMTATFVTKANYCPTYTIMSHQIYL